MIRVPTALAAAPMRLMPSQTGLGFSISPGFWENLPDLVTAGAKGTTQILQQTQKPYVIPGTSAIYYPNQTASTQTGLTLQNAGQGVAWGLTPMVLLAGMGVIVLFLMKK